MNLHFLTRLGTALRIFTGIGGMLLLSGSFLAAEELDSTTDCNGTFVADIDELREGRVADCNLDGQPDICSLQPNGFGFLSPPETQSLLRTGLQYSGAVFADFNNDSRVDVVAVETESEENVRLVVYLADESYHYSLGYSLNLSERASISVVKGARGNDVLISNFRESTAKLLENDGNASFTERTVFEISHDPFFPFFENSVDLNGDGLGDLITVDEEALRLSVRLNLGGGVFATPKMLYQGEVRLSTVVLSTPFGAGLPRIVTSRYLDSGDFLTPGKHVITSYMYDGSNFQEEGSLEIAAGTTTLLGVANFAGTEQNDILLEQDNSLQIIIDADFTQSSATPEAAGNGPCSFARIVDLDGDTDADLLCQHLRYIGPEGYATYLRSFFNDGSGRFFLADLTRFYTNSRELTEYPAAFTLAQTNGDQALDILAYWLSGDRQAVDTSIRRFAGRSEGPFYPAEVDENRNFIPDSCEVEGLPFRKFSLWNSYLQQMNILELFNPGTASATVEILLRNSLGAIAEHSYLNLNAGEKFDYVLNELATLASPSYGVVEVRSSAEIGGGLTVYRNTSLSSRIGLDFDPGEYDYVYQLPLSAPYYGDAHFIYNSLQPSAFGADAGVPVYEWLTLVNLSPEPMAFEIETRENLAPATSTRAVSLQPYQRVDVDGGHGFSVPLGVHKVSSVDARPVPYLVFLTRYGATFDPERFSFAFPLIPAQPLTGSVELVSTGGGAASWLEIANLSGEELGVLLPVQQDFSKEPENGGVTLSPYEHRHVYAPALIGENRTRAVYSHRVNSTEGTYLLQGTSYFYSPKTGAIETAFATQRDIRINDTLYSSYNLFLGTQNWLRVEDISISGETRLSVLGAKGNVLSTASLAGFLGSRIQELDLHNSSVYSTEPDSYGLLRLELFSSNSGWVEGYSASDVLRIKANPDASLDFIMRERLR